MKKDIWVVVANSWHARVFFAENNNTLKEVEILEHPQSREHDSELGSSKPGRTFDSFGMGRHMLEPKSSLKSLEFANFAKFLSDHLESAREQGKFKKLYLAAGPTFLGLLRQELPQPTVSVIAQEIDKDMTGLSPDEIRTHLPFVL